MPSGTVSWLDTLNESTNDALETSHAVANVYSFTSSPVLPTINIFFPELLNVRPVRLDSWLAILNESTNDALETSHAVANVYSFTSLPIAPAINIFFPEVLNAMPLAAVSWFVTLNVSTNDALETSHAVVNVNSFTWPSPSGYPTINIFFPELLNSMSEG